MIDHSDPLSVKAASRANRTRRTRERAGLKATRSGRQKLSVENWIGIATLALAVLDLILHR